MEEADEDERTAEELLPEELRTLEDELLLLEALEALLPEELRTLEDELLLLEALEALLPEDRTLEEELLLRDDEAPELERVFCWADDTLLREEEETPDERVLEEEETPDDLVLEEALEERVEDEPEPEDRLLLWLLRVEEELEEERVCAIPSDAISERASTKAVVIVTNLFIASQFLRLTV